MSTAYIGSTPPAGGSSGTDHHASWQEIITSQEVTIAERKQMIVFGVFINDGVLNVDGTLIVED